MASRHGRANGQLRCHRPVLCENLYPFCCLINSPRYIFNQFFISACLQVWKGRHTTFACYCLCRSAVEFCFLPKRFRQSRSFCFYYRLNLKIAFFASTCCVLSGRITQNTSHPGGALKNGDRVQYCRTCRTRCC